MKYFSFCPFFLSCVLLPLHLIAQNLVPNPSFEQYLDCPYSTAEFDTQVVDWHSWSVTPDYFHECSNGLEGFAGVPANAWGYQWPVSGVAYASVITYTHSFEDSREYIACQLNESLTVGNSYYVMFYISHYDGGNIDHVRCATDRFGLKFFKNPTYSELEGEWLLPTNTADIEDNEMLSDSANWTVVEGWFTADDAYNWIALGNFYDDNQTDTMQLGEPGFCYGMYYIDNVCIGMSPSDCSYLLSGISYRESINSLTIYPNPAWDEINLKAQERIEKIKVYNAIGQLIHVQDVGFQTVKINASAWVKGIYFIEIELDDQTIKKSKIIIQ